MRYCNRFFFHKFTDSYSAAPVVSIDITYASWQYFYFTLQPNPELDKHNGELDRWVKQGTLVGKSMFTFLAFLSNLSSGHVA